MCSQATHHGDQLLQHGIPDVPDRRAKAVVAVLEPLLCKTIEMLSVRTDSATAWMAYTYFTDSVGRIVSAAQTSKYPFASAETAPPTFPEIGSLERTLASTVSFKRTQTVPALDFDAALREKWKMMPVPSGSVGSGLDLYSGIGALGSVSDRSGTSVKDLRKSWTTAKSDRQTSGANPKR